MKRPSHIAFVRISIIIFILLHFRWPGYQDAAYSQIKPSKPVIDFDAIDNWPTLLSPFINDNGTYVAYMIRKPKTVGNILYIKSVKGRWSLLVDSISTFSFSPDNKKILYLNGRNQLVFHTLGTRKKIILSGITDFRYFKVDGANWLLYSGEDSKLTLCDLNKKRTISYNHVNSYLFSASDRFLNLIFQDKEMRRLSRLELSSLSLTDICRDLDFPSLVIDKTGSKFAYSKKLLDRSTEILHSSSSKHGVFITVPISIKIDTNLILAGINGFSEDGSHLIVKLQEKPRLKLSPDAVMVDIWNYHDYKLQSQQLNELQSNFYIALIDLKSNEIIWKQDDFEDIQILNDSLAMLRVLKSDMGESNWNSNAIAKFYLLKWRTGQKTFLTFKPLSISPDQKYFIGVDTASTFIDLTAYKIESGETIPLTEHLFVNDKTRDQYDIDDRRRIRFYGWLNDHILLFVDDYDLWKVDLAKPSHLICLTQGFGRKNGLILRVANRPKGPRALTTSDLKLLTAYNLKTKENGFYNLHNGGPAMPVKNTMKNCYFSTDGPSYRDYPPIKAQFADEWIVTKQSATEPTNYYLTKDFKQFKSISDFHPETHYNWLSASLINFKASSGRPLQGILYKPENFDSTKRYPVILNYYENHSNKINIFLDPDYSGDNINIPYFVSRGYLVFTPDIYLTQGKVAELAFDAVNGAADYLSNLPYVDSTKLGIQGHSFGGGETLQIITRTKRFAAAMAAAGHADLISASGSVNIDGVPFGREYVELAQGRIGYTLWERPDLYIENSPLFQADHIATPLLMVNNKQDRATNFSQGVEMFTALRRLKREVWMLQYDDEGHSVNIERNKRDCTLRAEQFFDHYLKNKPMPDWMRVGIPAKWKGYNKGY